VERHEKNSVPVVEAVARPARPEGIKKRKSSSLISSCDGIFIRHPASGKTFHHQKICNMLMLYPLYVIVPGFVHGDHIFGMVIADVEERGVRPGRTIS